MTTTDPTSYTAEQLAALGSHALHHLALRSSGTLAAYRLLLGRCLLAIQRTDLHYQHGCSSAIHYAIRVLGMPAKEARTLRYVARRLEELPRLSLEVTNGKIEWCKLREVVRVASPDTEAFWIELCSRHSYGEMERLVALTSYGQLPGEEKTRRDRSEFTEFRCNLSPEALLIVERGLQAMCQQAGKMLTMGEALELAFADQLSKHPLDEERLEKAREESQQMLSARDQALLQKCPVRDIEWLDTVEALTDDCPLNESLRLVAREPRVPSPKMRQQVLRRDGYRCATPGCPHHLFLHTHHIVFYCRGGKTVPGNLVVLCSRCHKNVHEGHLRIEGQAPHDLHFLDRQGRDLRYQHRLDTAHWLDIWLGWSGGELDSHYQMARYRQTA